MTLDLYKKIFHFFLIAIIISICYSGTLGNSWHFDDSHNIIKNKNIQISIDNLTWEDIKNSFYSPSDGRIHRPLARLSFALNYLFSGQDITSYHVVNIIIHIVCSIFVYLVFLATLRIYRERNGSLTSDHLIQDIALLGAIFWAIHPIQTQAVTYIVQRMASMAAMFYMIAMYCYIKFRQNGGLSQQVFFLFLAFCFWIAGVATKENVVMLPLILLGYEIAFFKISPVEKLKYFVMMIILFTGVSFFAFLFMRGEIFNYIDSLYSFRYYTMWQRLITEPIILSQYLFLLICPIADFLTLESDIIASSSLLSPPHTIFANLFIFSLTLFGILFLRKYPIIAFALYFYFINHIVESSFIGLELYFEHRNYLSSIFIYFSIAYYLFLTCWSYNIRNKKFMYILFVVFITFMIVSAGNATYLRNEVWKDEISLNLDNIEKAPSSPRAFNNLAAEYIRLGQTENALQYLKEAEDIYKRNQTIYQENNIADIYYNAGIIYLHAKKDIEKAVQLFLKSVELDPLGFEQHFYLGVAFFKLGDIDNAETAIFNAVQLKDDEAPMYNFFARVLYEQGKYDLAVKILNRGLQIEKRRDMFLNLATVYLAMGDLKKAKSIFLSIDSDDNDLLYLLNKLALDSSLEKDSLINKIVNLIERKNINYCALIAEINENKNTKLIYPDISFFREKLDKFYIDNMVANISSMVDIIDLKVNLINGVCNDL